MQERGRRGWCLCLRQRKIGLTPPPRPSVLSWLWRPCSPLPTSSVLRPLSPRSMGLYEDVSLEPSTHLAGPEDASGPAKVDLTLKLIERKTGGLSMGGGISSQAYGEGGAPGFIGNIAYSERNLFGLNQKLTLSAEIGQNEVLYRRAPKGWLGDFALGACASFFFFRVGGGWAVSSWLAADCLLLALTAVNSSSCWHSLLTAAGGGARSSLSPPPLQAPPPGPMGGHQQLEQGLPLPHLHEHKELPCLGALASAR